MNRYTFPIVLPVSIDVGSAFFTAAIRETIAQEKFAQERAMYSLDQNVEYISRLLLHSVLFSNEHMFGIWGTKFVSLSEIDAVRTKLASGRIDAKAARELAEQLLLRLGFEYDHPFRPIEVSWLRNCGCTLYERAAQSNSGSPLGEQLRSMSGNFWSWIGILQDMRRRESIQINA